jgi:hypothetical protein
MTTIECRATAACQLLRKVVVPFLRKAALPLTERYAARVCQSAPSEEQPG